jgi:beta-N-acetylglucosaminidase
MAEKLDDNELVTFKELLMANNYQVDALTQLLIEKGIITEQEFYFKLKQVQLQYKKNKQN